MAEPISKRLKIVAIDEGQDNYVFGVTDNASTAIIQWEERNELVREVLSYVDVVSLIQLKPISKRWKEFCICIIDEKPVRKYGSIQPFKTNKELREAVQKYERRHDKKDAEEIATKYGWPINKWDISNLDDLTGAFRYQHDFNENISSWDTSNVTDMTSLFLYASAFNQDISSWNTSNVRCMKRLFEHAPSFNQDISSWNISAVRNMDYMFAGATNFNQDLSSWDVSNLYSMEYMFHMAESFNQDLSPWIPERVVSFRGMFFGAESFNKDYVDSWYLGIMQIHMMFNETRIDHDYNSCSSRSSSGSSSSSSNSSRNDNNDSDDDEIDYDSGDSKE